jgi:hypothetical protein|tara:strand:- start:20 stop:268 length:249 start_codon:yes stop_codon:yes gene_type:complete
MGPTSNYNTNKKLEKAHAKKEKMIGKNSKFKVGDKAFKPKGYKYPCTIVSVFETTSGEVRIVGEMDDYKMLHIFNETQLEHI